MEAYREHLKRDEYVAPELIQEIENIRSTGFIDWSTSDYDKFLKSFIKRSINDIEGIASDVQTKKPKEIVKYMKVFMQRFRELKDRNVVVRKFVQ